MCEFQFRNLTNRRENCINANPPRPFVLFHNRHPYHIQIQFLIQSRILTRSGSSRICRTCVFWFFYTNRKREIAGDYRRNRVNPYYSNFLTNYIRLNPCNSRLNRYYIRLLLIYTQNKRNHPHQLHIYYIPHNGSCRA